MPERTFRQLELSAAVVAALVAALAWGPNPSLALGIAIGSAWNLASLWCLARLLQAWLGPQRSTRRVVGWLLAKFSLLFLLALACFRLPVVSMTGISVGLTMVLVVVISGFALQARRAQQVQTHGR